MKALLVGGPDRLSQDISLILKVRWPLLSLLHISDSTQASQFIYQEQPDMTMLHFPTLGEEPPALHCFDLICQIRSFSSVPIIVVSERNEAIDKARALQLGADDWISPTAMPMEFIARVAAILRRCSPSGNHPLPFANGKLRISYATHEVFVSGKPVKLTPIEYKILCYLAENRGSVVSSAELLRHVWGPNYEDDKELLKISIFRLRAKIEEDPAKPQIILSERGVGYIMRSPEAQEPPLVPPRSNSL